MWCIMILGRSILYESHQTCVSVSLCFLSPFLRIPLSLFSSQPRVCDLKPRDGSFVGRETELSELAQTLLSRDTVVETVADYREEGGVRRRPRSPASRRSVSNEPIGGDGGDDGDGRRSIGGGGSLGHTPTSARSWLSSSVDFCGRAAEVWGGDGVGKSALVYEYAWRAVYNAGEYSGGVITLQADGDGDGALGESIRQTLLNRIADGETQHDKWRKDISRMQPGGERNQNEAWNIMHRWLQQQRKPILVILLNIENGMFETQVWNDLHKLRHVHVLKTCTAQSQSVRSSEPLTPCYCRPKSRPRDGVEARWRQAGEEEGEEKTAAEAVEDCPGRIFGPSSENIGSIEVHPLDELSAKQLVVQHAMSPGKQLPAFPRHLESERWQTVDMFLDELHANEAQALGKLVETRDNYPIYLVMDAKLLALSVLETGEAGMFTRFMAENPMPIIRSDGKIRSKTPEQSSELAEIMTRLGINDTQRYIDGIRDEDDSAVCDLMTEVAMQLRDRGITKDKIREERDKIKHAASLLTPRAEADVSAVLYGRSVARLSEGARHILFVMAFMASWGIPSELLDDLLSRNPGFSKRTGGVGGSGKSGCIEELRNFVEIQQTHNYGGGTIRIKNWNTIATRVRTLVEQGSGNVDARDVFITACGLLIGRMKEWEHLSGCGSSEPDKRLVFRLRSHAEQVLKHAETIFTHHSADADFVHVGSLPIKYLPIKSKNESSDGDGDERRLCEGLATLHFWTGRLHVDFNPAQALQYFEASIGWCKRVGGSLATGPNDGNAVLLARCLHAQSVAFQRLGRLSDAMVKCKESYKVHGSDTDHQDIAESLHRESEIEFRKNTRKSPRLAQAKLHCVGALEMRKRISNGEIPRGTTVGQLQLQVAKDQHLLSQILNAQSEAQTTVANKVKAEKKTTAVPEWEAANVCAVQLAKEAQTMCDKALATRKRVHKEYGDEVHLDIACSLRLEGVIFLDRSQCIGGLDVVRDKLMKDAQASVKAAMSMFKRICNGDDSIQLANCLEVMSKLERAHGRKQDAHDLLKRALDMKTRHERTQSSTNNRTSGMRHEEIMMRKINLAELKLEIGNLGDANDLFEEAVHMSTSFEDSGSVSKALRAQWDLKKQLHEQISSVNGDSQESETKHGIDEGVDSTRPFDSNGSGLGDNSSFDAQYFGGDDPPPLSPPKNLPLRRPDGGALQANAARTCSRNRDPFRDPLEKTDPAWIQDNARSQCKNCNRAFHFFRRKHHCRQCGEVN